MIKEIDVTRITAVLLTNGERMKVAKGTFEIRTSFSFRYPNGSGQSIPDLWYTFQPETTRDEPSDTSHCGPLSAIACLTASKQ